MDWLHLPTLNACLNGLAGTLLVVGRVLIRRGRERAHRLVMTSAFAVSSLFLISYVIHKWSRNFENTHFGGEGLAQTGYFVLLATHVPLAMMVPVLAITLIVLALGERRVAHRRLARIAWPIWMYVSVSGVLIYLLLYPFNPVK